MPYIKQLDASKWVEGVARPVVWMRATPRELCLSHGIQFYYDEGGWGLGDVEEALMETRSGRPFGLIRYPQASEKNYTAILVDEKLDDVTSVVNEIMCDLELRSSDMLVFDLERCRFLPCVFIRMDDHGNRVQVGEYDCYPDAFFEKEILERRGHKQTYLIEMSEPKPKGWVGKR